MTYSQVYLVAEDTLLLLQAAQEEVRPDELVLEIGTGSGHIASTLSGTAKVVATDVNPHAVRHARMKGVDVVRADLFDGISGRFDLILFNPPYLPTGEGERIDDWFEYALDGGESGREVIERFVVQASSALAPGGRVLLLISSLTGENEVVRTLHESGFCVEVVKRAVIEGGEELLVLRCTIPSDRI